MVSKRDEQGQAPEAAHAAAPHDETIHAPRPSYWPLVLTLAIMVTVVGVLVHPALIVVGALAVFAAIVAWGLEGGTP